MEKHLTIREPSTCGLVAYRLTSVLCMLIQTEAERRRREAGVKQSMEIRVRSCMWVGGWVGMYGIWNYLANQGT